MSAVHEGKKKLVECQKCDKSFKQQGLLKIHLNEEHESHDDIIKVEPSSSIDLQSEVARSKIDLSLSFDSLTEMKM